MSLNTHPSQHHHHDDVCCYFDISDQTPLYVAMWISPIGVFSFILFMYVG